MKTVYILGAGFSFPLGGPLMGQLLTHSTYDRMIQRFPTVKRDEFEKLALDLYRGHIGVHWSDPEEFLERLERAIADGKNSTLGGFIYEYVRSHAVGAINAARNICVSESVGTEFADARFASALPRHLRKHVVSNGLPIAPIDSIHKVALGRCGSSLVDLASDLLAGAKRLLAADCSLFFEMTHVAEDKWTPYRNWLMELGTDTTIITFNYDMVLESIAEHLKMERIRARLPHEGDCDKQVDVLKLHGSLNWSYQNGIVGASNDRIPVALNGGGLQPVMGTPGPEKLKLTTNALAPLWTAAMRRISSANRVVFLGYRLPSTDAYSRRAFRDAFQSADSRIERVQIVLGPPEVSRDHAQRMKRLLIAMTPSNCTVEILPFGTEDFLDLEQTLLRPDARGVAD